MSHFLVIALLPKTTLDIEDALGKLMAPYFEGLEVPEYQKPCSCGTWQARTDATNATTEKLGSFQLLRDSFNEKVKADPQLTKQEAKDPFDGTRDAWQAHVKPWLDEEEAIFNELMKTSVPLITCDECRGSGTYLSTYNPKSKWDWFSIGGRWTGYLDNYEPAKDPANTELCRLCNGTGTRHDIPVYEEGTSPLERNDSGCQGTGTAVKWPSEWVQHPGDIIPAQKLVDAINTDPERYTPFAYITPDVEWKEKGEMGWWAIVHNEKPGDDWRSQVREDIERYANDCIAVVVDCHI
jgi:hypothetical protein